MPMRKPYTLPSRAKSQPHDQNLSKSMSCPPRLNEKYDRTTSCIVHLADCANFESVTSNKLCSGLTGLCFKSPNDTIHVTVTAKCKKTDNRTKIESNPLWKNRKKNIDKKSDT